MIQVFFAFLDRLLQVGRGPVEVLSTEVSGDSFYRMSKSGCRFHIS